MFVIHYTDAQGSLVAIEGPMADKREAETYLDTREHYLEFTPRILSLSAPRAAKRITSVPALPAPSPAELSNPCTCGFRHPAQPEFA